MKWSRTEVIIALCVGVLADTLSPFVPIVAMTLTILVITRSKWLREFLQAGYEEEWKQ